MRKPVSSKCTNNFEFLDRYIPLIKGNCGKSQRERERRLTIELNEPCLPVRNLLNYQRIMFPSYIPIISHYARRFHGKIYILVGYGILHFPSKKNLSPHFPPWIPMVSPWIPMVSPWWFPIFPIIFSYVPTVFT